MRVTLALSRQHYGRWFNDKWKLKKRVTINDHKLRESLQAQGKEVFDAAKLFGVDNESDVDRYARQPPEQVQLVDPPPSDPHHDVPAYTYYGRSLLLGLPQAQAITNTVLVGEGLPERVTALEGLERLNNQDELVSDVIRAALMFDATQEKLKRVIDITRLGLRQPREWGIPEKRSTRSLFSGLLSLCERTSLGPASTHSRMVLYKPHLQATNVTAGGYRLLLSRRPAVALLADAPLPPVAPPDAVDATRATPAPDLAPVSPYTHLRLKDAYDWRDLPSVGAGCRHRHVHTLFVAWNTRLKHLVNDDQLGAMSLMSLYAAGLHMRRQQESPEPATIQCVATDGRLFKFSVLQLNTTEMPEPTSGAPSTRHALKNLLWTEPAVHLYEECGYKAGRPVLSGYNPDVFPRFLAMYTNGLLARTFDTSESVE